ncbi:MAG: ABC transporter ATP-binding protein [Rhodothermales bacterium]
MSTEPRFESVHKLWHLLKPYKGRVITLSLLISASAALGTVGPQFIRIAFDTVIPSQELQMFVWLGLGFIGFYLIRAAVNYAGMYYSFAFTQSIISDIRMRSYSRLLRLPVERFTSERSGSMVSRVVSDVNALQGMIQAGSTRLAGQLFSILVILAIVISMNWQLALVNLVVVPALAYITKYYQEPMRHASRLIRKRVGEMTAVASEVISNIQVVKSFASEANETEKFGTENDAYVRYNLDRRKDVGLMESLVTVTAEYGIGAILLLGGWQVAQGLLSVGELTAFLLYQRMLQRPVMSVMFFNNQLQSGMAALERVADLLETETEQEGDIKEKPEGSIQFKNVTFSYPGTTEPVLHDLNFSIDAGKTVAFVGPSGSGKSTITKLLARFFDPDAGKILMGDRDIKDFELEALRQSIAIVPQEPTLFSGSVRENIGYARPGATEEEIHEAAKVANAHDFILALEEGYDTKIGERGVKLSGGQKQRVAIARAILKEANMLILDEATASLDSESEAIIQDALAGSFSRNSQLTTLVIAHRLSTIQDANNIMVLEKGRLLDAGTHSELMERKGLYNHLYELQFRAETVNVS